ncbi:MAG: hypothetical protein AAGC45_06120 [Bacteroidota bacterium]
MKSQDDNLAGYPDHIGYLDASNPDMDIEFNRCNPDLLPVGFYSSSFKTAFSANPSTFKKIIKQKFNAQYDYDDSGFVMIRFIIDCNGNIGDYEVNSLNKDYKRTAFSNDLVNILIDLCLDKKHWRGRKDIDTYMYLILKIQNGQVLEIIP